MCAFIFVSITRQCMTFIVKIRHLVNSQTVLKLNIQTICRHTVWITYPIFIFRWGERTPDGHKLNYLLTSHGLDRNKQWIEYSGIHIISISNEFFDAFWAPCIDDIGLNLICIHNKQPTRHTIDMCIDSHNLTFIMVDSQSQILF